MAYGLPAGILALGGAMSGGPGFQGAFSGALNAFGQAEQQRAAMQAAELKRSLDLARAEQQLRADELAAEEYRRQQSEESNRQQALAEYIGQVPDEQRAVAEAFPEAYAKQAIQAQFREPDEGTSLEQNLQAAGLQPGSPEYQQAVMEAITRPQVSINQPVKPPTGYENVYDDSGNLVSQRIIPGGPADPRQLTTTQRNEMAKMKSSRDSIISQLDKYSSEIARLGIPGVGSKDKDRLEAMQGQLILDMKEAFNLGVLNAGDLPALQKLLKDPFSFQTRAKMLAENALTGESMEDRAIANVETVKELLSDRYNAVLGIESPDAGAPDIKNRIRSLGVSRDDLEFTARKHGMTVEQVLNELEGQ